MAGQPKHASVLRAGPRISVPLSEFEWSTSSSGGPGGQNVNRVQTKVTLRWDVERSAALTAELKARLRARYPRRITQSGELLLSSQRFRSQPRNWQDCLDKLREMLLEAARRPSVRVPTRVPRGAIERRLSEKRHRSRTKRDRRERGDG